MNSLLHAWEEPLDITRFNFTTTAQLVQYARVASIERYTIHSEVNINAHPRKGSLLQQQCLPHMIPFKIQRVPEQNRGISFGDTWEIRYTE